MNPWFCIKTNRYKERWVTQQLAGWCDEVYLPLLREFKKVRRQFIWAVEPLFPGYLFARFELDRDLAKVRSTPGLGKVLSASEEGPIVVDEKIVKVLRERSKNGYIEIRPGALLPGDEVEVMNGPFRGLTALFEKSLKEGERIIILLDLLSSRVRVQVPRVYVQKFKSGFSRQLRA